jgi:hypothetical protein
MNPNTSSNDTSNSNINNISNSNLNNTSRKKPKRKQIFFKRTSANIPIVRLDELIQGKEYLIYYKSANTKDTKKYHPKAITKFIGEFVGIYFGMSGKATPENIEEALKQYHDWRKNYYYTGATNPNPSPSKFIGTLPLPDGSSNSLIRAYEYVLFKNLKIISGGSEFLHGTAWAKVDKTQPSGYILDEIPQIYIGDRPNIFNFTPQQIKEFYTKTFETHETLLAFDSHDWDFAEHYNVEKKYAEELSKSQNLPPDVENMIKGYLGGKKRYKRKTHKSRRSKKRRTMKRRR